MFSLLLILALGSFAEARIGGGGMRGGRGFRSFGTRSAPTQPMRPAQPNYQSPGQPQGSPYSAQPQPGMGGGSFSRGLMGGLAGGMIGSMLFGRSGYGGGMGGGGGGGFGLIELLLLAGIGYWLYNRFVRSRSPLSANGYYRTEPTPIDTLRAVPAGPFASEPTGGSEELSRYDRNFNFERFKEERMDDFVRLQAAWNHRDLSSVSRLLTTEIRSQLDSDISTLKRDGQINRIENIAVRGTDLVEAWAERGNLYATLRFRANLTDYTVSESTGAVVAGDRENPIKFEEDWTFVRPIDDVAGWQLTAIEA